MPEERPFIHAMVLCDHAHKDAATGKYTLIGTFNEIGAHEYPVTHPSCCIFISLSHWVKRQALAISFVRESTDLICRTPDLIIPEREPVERVEFSLSLNSLQIPSPGYYEFQVLVSGNMVHEFFFKAVKLGEA